MTRPSGTSCSTWSLRWPTRCESGGTTSTSDANSGLGPAGEVGGGEVGAVRLKRVFYAIRPAVTLHWLDSHEGVPPMNLDELLAETLVPDDVLGEVAELRELKSRTRELGSAPAPRAIAAWAEATFAAEEREARAAGPELRDRATDGFLAMLDRWAPDAV